MAGMDMKRIANLPPVVPNDTLRATLTPYGKIMGIQTEMWSKAYRHSVFKDIRQVTIILRRHVLSHLTVAAHNLLLSYEAQVATCYGCGEAVHIYQGCPARQKSRTVKLNAANATYASIVTANVAPAEDPVQNITTKIGNNFNKGSDVYTTPDLGVSSKDTDTNIAEAVAPPHPDIGAPPARTEGIDTVVHDALQRIVVAESRKKMEKDTARASSTIRQNIDLQNHGTMSGSSSIVHHSEDMSTKSDCEDSTMADKDSNPIHRDRGKTGGLTSQPETQLEDEGRQNWQATTRAVSQPARKNAA